MTTKRIFNVGSILLMFVSFIFMVSCDKDDDTPNDPGDTVTLNMLDEQNGHTPLGESDVYINKANNFHTFRSLIADAGNAYGIGVKMSPKLDNLVREVAVTPGHIYQIFDPSTLYDFPSGVRAVQVGTAYYKTYVVSSITKDTELTGAVVKYVLAYPDAKGLPEMNSDYGIVNDVGDEIRIALPKGVEYFFDTSNAEYFTVSLIGNKLVVQLKVSSNDFYEIQGTYKINIRLGNVYSSVLFTVR
ncbi:MAG: DUF5036 family protein [Odoribacter sp.]